jgi:hypothetical protein
MPLNAAAISINVRSWVQMKRMGTDRNASAT